MKNLQRLKEEARIEELISEKVNDDKKKFSFTNDCEKCKSLPEGNFCSKEHYYRTKFDFKSSYIKNAMLIAPNYFEIKKDKKDEFLEFLQNLIDIYY